jgi:hypothetical protein
MAFSFFIALVSIDNNLPIGYLSVVGQLIFESHQGFVMIDLFPLNFSDEKSASGDFNVFRIWENGKLFEKNGNVDHATFCYNFKKFLRYNRRLWSHRTRHH